MADAKLQASKEKFEKSYFTLCEEEKIKGLKIQKLTEERRKSLQADNGIDTADKRGDVHYRPNIQLLSEDVNDLFTKLTMRGWKLATTQLQIILKSLVGSTIQQLNLSNAGLKEEHFSLLCSYLPVTIKQLNLDQNPEIPEIMYGDLFIIESAGMKQLSLRMNNIGDVGAKSISTTIKKNKTLRWLDLSMNHIGKEGVLALTHELRLNGTLQALSLANNRVDDMSTQGFSKLIQAFGKRVEEVIAKKAKGNTKPSVGSINVPNKIKEETTKETADAKGKAKNTPTASTTASANTTNPAAKKGPTATIVAEGGRPRSRTNTSTPTSASADSKKPATRLVKKSKEEEGIPEDSMMNLSAENIAPEPEETLTTLTILNMVDLSHNKITIDGVKCLLDAIKGLDSQILNELGPGIIFLKLNDNAFNLGDVHYLELCKALNNRNPYEKIKYLPSNAHLTE